MKARKLHSLLFAVSLSVSAGAQTKFNRFFWRDAELTVLNTVTQTADGGYVLAGTIKDLPIDSLKDIFLVKFTSMGDSAWTRRIGGSGTDVATSVQQTSDGGLIITGHSNSYGSNYDCILVKTDSVGNVSWAKSYGSSVNDKGYSVRQNSDNGYIIIGRYNETNPKRMVIRTDSSGDTLWTRTFGNNYLNDVEMYAEQTADGGFIITSNMDSSFYNYGLVSKLTSAGNPVWANKIISSGGSYSGSLYAAQTLDGGYIVVSREGIPSYSTSVHKFDSNGNFSFGKKFISAIISSPYGKIKQLPDSSYLFAMYSPFSANSFLLKLNSVLDTIWTKRLDNTSFSDIEFTGNGIVASAVYNNSAGICKLDTSFNAECTVFTLTGNNTGNSGAFNTTLILSGDVINVNTISPSIIPGSSRRLYSSCMPDVPVCIVTVDSATQNNLVVWEENFDTSFVDSYNVYKETSVAGNYALIGNVPDAQLSTFLDAASNPAVQPERYRVSAVWNTFYERPNASTGHKTIHLTTSLGLPPAINLLWSSYSGFSYSTYNIWRGNSSSASIIASVPFGTNSYTDLSPPAGDSLYFIEVIHTPCNPTAVQPHPSGNESDGSMRDMTSQISGTRSNIVNRYGNVGVEEMVNSNIISVFPNPVKDQLIISSPFVIDGIEIYNVFGQKIFSQQQKTNSRQQTVDVSRLNPEIYFLRVRSGQIYQALKIVKE